MSKPIALRVILASFLTSTLLSASFLVSCTPSTPPPLPTELQPPSPTAAPSETALPSQTPTAFPTLTPELERPQYVIDLQMNYSAKAAEVNQTITYPNWTGETLTNLVLAVEPNLWSGGFDLRSLTLDQLPITNYVLEPQSQRLEIPLPQPLPPSGTITITMNYGLILPQMQAYSNPNEVRPQIYGYSDRQVNFVDWYPFIVPYVSGQGWLLHNPWFYGEHLVYDAADFDVTVSFTDGTTPQIAASGAEVASGSATSRKFELDAGRTFALSISTVYKVATQTVGDVKIYAYYFAFFDSPGEALLQTTVQALQVFTEKFGPYRHKTLTAVQGDFDDGMEFSAFYFISYSYFNQYQGTPNNYLVYIAAHETAHQWWFDRVANDQAIEPWLDEALATYSERIYLETVYPDSVDLWQDYRYFEFENAGFVDTQIYDGGGQRPYWDKVYLTGARFLDELRKRVGDEIFFAFLKDYYSQYAGKRASAVDFFRVLREHTSADISDLMAKYFKNNY
ncbi:MAG: M1 family metallopeptidase [Anaerolineales bacterium]|nr:M1 family metallopeptidase [Anaerolineales bacterium]